MLFVGCAGHFVDVNILNQESFVIYLIISLFTYLFACIDCDSLLTVSDGGPKKISQVKI
jgi:hypothetical protein